MYRLISDFDNVKFLGRILACWGNDLNGICTRALDISWPECNGR